GPDGLPKTRRISTDGSALDPNNKGDVQATIRGKDGRARRVFVDRAPMKRIMWAHDVAAPTVLPDLPHYRHGLRSIEPSLGFAALLPADEATAKRTGVAFLDPHEALARAAEKAVEVWTKTYGEPPPVDTWPDALRPESLRAHAVNPGPVLAT